eukprot:c5874_g1_i1.p1 GENE.c5874_g1_i1~~c5874_g1_i1.p1  ORF type:complete len:437 (+),score=89.27 c5874_g1_i1:130-1311(+)
MKGEHERPFRIFLVRHGESEGNVNPDIYKTTPDAKLKLTKRGLKMGERAGEEIQKALLKLYPDTSHPPRIVVYVSSFHRTIQTARAIMKGMGDTSDWIKSVRESPLLVEQDWGLFEGSGMDGAEKKYPDEWIRCQIMKQHQGRFWARFPLGESCFDVCQRMQILFGSIVRDRIGGRGHRKGSKPTDVAIVVSHGITIRAFVMMWCHRTPEWFETSRNPPNASVRLIDSTIETWDAGYIFGGYRPNTDLSTPVDMTTLVDPSELNAFCRLRRIAFLEKTADSDEEFEETITNAKQESPNPDLNSNPNPFEVPLAAEPRLFSVQSSLSTSSTSSSQLPCHRVTRDNSCLSLASPLPDGSPQSLPREHSHDPGLLRRWTAFHKLSEEHNESQHRVD